MDRGKIMKNFIFFKSILLSIAWINTALFANPEDPSVISGNATFSQIDNTLNVQATNDAIINWQSFSIDKNETTNFLLPTVDSTVLNRVVGPDLSNISGKLESNGNVYLINPNGILISKDGIINTASFLASTVDIKDHLFLNKNLIFDIDSNTSIVNLGSITTTQGDITLLSYHVKNEGQLESKNGSVLIGGGKKFILMPHEKEKLSVAISVENEKEEDGIINAGVIKALQVELKADGNIYKHAIKNEGMINATSVKKENGKVFLVAQNSEVTTNGKIKASKADIGGEVRILGSRVRVYDNAVIDVSGNLGGGEILLGGDYKRENPDIFNADITFVEESSQIKADAVENGNGGRVILWSDRITANYGLISSKGGRDFGDGGFVEISSLGHIFPKGQVDTSALNGKVGMLVLDPGTINITGATANIAWAAGVATPTANTATLSVADILAQLALTDVTVDATGGPGTGTGNINVNSSITVNGATYNTRTLFLKAYNNVDVNQPITFSETSANLILEAGNDGAGNITIDQDLTFSSAGTGTSGDLTLRTASGQNGNIQIRDPVIFDSSGTMTVSAGSDFTVNTADSITLNGTGDLSITAADDATINGTITINGTGTLTFNITDNLNINNLVKNTSTGDINVTVGGDLSMGNGNQNEPHQLGTFGGTLTLNIDGGLEMIGGRTDNDWVQIGYDTGDVSSDIIFTKITGDLIMKGGARANAETCYSLIGHGANTSGAATRSGNITITEIGGSIEMLGGATDDSFVQIGHVSGTSGAVSATGNISITDIGGFISIAGGLSNNEPGTYALIGHGGKKTTQNDTYTGSITITRAAGAISAYTLNSGFDQMLNALNSLKFAGIGHTAYADGSDITINCSALSITSGNDIVVGVNSNSEAFIGPRIVTTNSGTGIISNGSGSAVPITIVTENAGDLSLSSNTTSQDFHGTVLGAYVNTAQTFPLAESASSSAQSNISLTIDGGLTVSAGNSSSTNTEAYAYIVNSSGSPTGTFDISASIGADIFIQGGGGFASINSQGGTAGTLSSFSSTAGDIRLLAHLNTDQNRGASIKANGTSVFTANHLFMEGTLPIGSEPQALIQNTSGTLTITVVDDVEMKANSKIDLSGSGLLSVTATNGEVSVVNGSVISQSGTGNVTVTTTASTGGDIFIQGGEDVSSITSNAVTTINANNDLYVIGGALGAGIIQGATGVDVDGNHIIFRGGSGSNNAMIKNTISGNLAIDAKKAILMDHTADVELSAGSGTLNINAGISASEGDLSVLNKSTIKNLSTGKMTINVYDNIFLNAGYEGHSLVSSAGELSLTSQTGDLEMTGTGEGASSITSAGTTDITAKHCVIRGGGSSTPATISNTTGNLTFVTSRDCLMDHHAFITLSGTGNLTATIGFDSGDDEGDLKLINDSSITNTGTGSVTVTVKDNTILAGGYETNGNATISASNSTVSVTSGTDVYLIGSATGVASIASQTGTTINTDHFISRGADPSFMSLIQAQTGNLTVTANDSILLDHHSCANIVSGSGTLTLTAGNGSSADIEILTNSYARHQGSGNITMTAATNINIDSGYQGAAFVQANGGNITMTAGNTMAIFVNEGGNAYVTNSGPITMTADNFYVAGKTDSNQAFVSNSSGDILIKATNDLSIRDDSYITTTGVGNVTLVLDQQAPAAPAVGAGRLYLDGSANVNTNGGTLRIFTATPSQNQTLGKMNGDSLPSNPSINQVYDTYFNTFAGGEGTPFTVFYKSSGISSGDISLVALIGREFYDRLKDGEMPIEHSFHVDMQPDDLKVPIYNIYPYTKYPVFIRSYIGMTPNMMIFFRNIK